MELLEIILDCSSGETKRQLKQLREKLRKEETNPEIAGIQGNQIRYKDGSIGLSEEGRRKMFG
jgi:hypothetical protein